MPKQHTKQNTFKYASEVCLMTSANVFHIQLKIQLTRNNQNNNYTHLSTAAMQCPILTLFLIDYKT